LPVLYIVNNSNDPYFNLALEEYLHKELDLGQDYFLLWQNRPAVIVGRNQNTWDEVNLDFVREHHVAVVRRLTGGGAVYHDLGNLNFTFILRNQRGRSYDFARFLLPVVGALAGLGLNARIDGRNDISIDGRKISGNSQYRYRDRILHHGTLMFSVDLDLLERVLASQSRQDRIQGGGLCQEQGDQYQ
jgi:lipoate-protein ligase A